MMRMMILLYMQKLTTYGIDMSKTKNSGFFLYQFAPSNHHRGDDYDNNNNTDAIQRCGK